MCNQGPYAVAAERAGHPEQMYGFQYTCLTTAVTPKEDVDLLQVLESYLAKIPDLMYL